MRYLLMSTVAAGALLATAVGPASAADLAVRPAPAPVYAPVYSWTGFYLGLNAGAAWHENEDWDLGFTAFGVRLGGVGFGHDNGDDVGFTGGVTGGINWQMGQLVLGLEGDVNYLDRSNDHGWNGATFTLVNVPGVNFTVFGADEGDDDFFATARARAGFAVNGLFGQSTLLYVTGGAAWTAGHHDAVVSVVATNAAGRPLAVTSFGTEDGDNWGWTVGAGAEVAITPNISVKLEYLFASFDSDDVIDPIASIALGAPVTFEVDREFHIVRAGVNFRFGWTPAPAPAPAAVVTKG